jgi:hypothetical protein
MKVPFLHQPAPTELSGFHSIISPILSPFLYPVSEQIGIPQKHLLNTFTKTAKQKLSCQPFKNLHVSFEVVNCWATS